MRFFILVLFVCFGRRFYLYTLNLAFPDSSQIGLLTVWISVSNKVFVHFVGILFSFFYFFFLIHKSQDVCIVTHLF